MSSNPDNLLNLKSEELGLNFLLEKDLTLIKPTLEQKKQLISILKIPNIYLKSFDLVRLKVNSFDQIRNKIDFELIEVKVTKKYLKDFPKGFFFGMTQNEEILLQELDGIFKLCLISINEKDIKSLELNFEGLNSIIKTKRIQYQINL